jgi:hypothetical protein
MTIWPVIARALPVRMVHQRFLLAHDLKWVDALGMGILRGRLAGKSATLHSDQGVQRTFWAIAGCG